jgi:hypothetical protein
MGIKDTAGAAFVGACFVLLILVIVLGQFVIPKIF